MPAVKEDAGEYRALAAACREMAAKAHDPQNKQAWLRLAGDWLAMADEADGAEASPPAQRHSHSN